jgi:hypothetical protein
MNPKVLVAVLTAVVGIAPTVTHAASTSIGSTAAIAPQIAFSVPVDINFGELAVPNSAAGGSYTIGIGGAPNSAVNATQIDLASVQAGSITISGRKATTIDFSITPGAFTCDTTYTATCVGTAGLSLTMTHSFGTAIDDTCAGVRCTEVVEIGGDFAFPAAAEGRWTNTLTITANYQ